MLTREERPQKITRSSSAGASGEIEAFFKDTPAPSANIINESGLYRLIMRSDKATARPFQDWVTKDVLPAIRKTGGYCLNEEARATAHADTRTAMPLPEEFQRVFAALMQPVILSRLSAVFIGETRSGQLGPSLGKRTFPSAFDSCRRKRSIRPENHSEKWAVQLGPTHGERTAVEDATSAHQLPRATCGKGGRGGWECWYSEGTYRYPVSSTLHTPTTNLP
jgi:hypothetical protein